MRSSLYVTAWVGFCTIRHDRFEGVNGIEFIGYCFATQERTPSQERLALSLVLAAMCVAGGCFMMEGGTNRQRQQRWLLPPVTLTHLPLFPRLPPLLTHLPTMRLSHHNSHVFSAAIQTSSLLLSLPSSSPRPSSPRSVTSVAGLYWLLAPTIAIGIDSSSHVRTFFEWATRLAVQAAAICRRLPSSRPAAFPVPSRTTQGALHMCPFLNRR